LRLSNILKIIDIDKRIKRKFFKFSNSGDIMNRKEIIIVVLLIVVAFVAGFFISKINFTGQVIQNDYDDNYTLTKAICNNGKCIDVFIECLNGEVQSVIPVSDLIEVNFNDFEINNSRLCD